MTALVCVENLSFKYPQNASGLPQVSFTLAQGDGLAISTPSGSGKSTLARCLAGLIPHLYHGRLDGCVWLDGLRTDRTPLWRLSEIAGLVFQNPSAQMLCSSVEEEIIFGLENLGLSQAEITRRVGEALDQFGLSGFRKRSPLTLSGGEQQKLALAAILARRPKVLLLDEPISMLDTTAALDFVGSLDHSLAGGQALVVCEHRSEYFKSINDLKYFSINGSTSSEMADVQSIPGEEGGESGALWPSAPVDLCLEGRGLKISRGERMLFDGLDVSLRGGEVTAIVGRNGIGKTTLLRVFAGLQSYTGELAVQMDGRQCLPHLGLTFQNPNLQLFNATAGQEILFKIPDPDPGLYQRLLRIMDLTRYENTPPLLLSEGEKRRLALAIILMQRPAHGILLDEPALGQDSLHKMHLLKILRHVAAEGRLVIFATHDIQLAAQADRLLLLGPHGFAADGAPKDVLPDQSAWTQLGLRVPEWVIPKEYHRARPQKTF